MSRSVKILLAAWLVVAWMAGFVGAQEPTEDNSPPDAVEKSFAHVQILNGISPHNVTLSIDGRPVYPGIGPGTRISSFGLPEREWKLEIGKDGSEAKKEFKLRFPREGFYTVVLTGDFAELPPVAGADGVSKPDYRVKASFLANKKPAGSTVDVRVVNGAGKGSVRLMRDKQEQCAAPPGDTATAANQPADLFMEAVHEDVKIPLYIAQEAPAANLTIVFYKEGETTNFRAMAERWQAAAE
jgi:hypothetical protein